jgi:hypothetical protein
VTEKYQVKVDSVLNCQMEDHDYNVQCETFVEAKEYALGAFETVIERLNSLCELMRAAYTLEALDLGYWEPLFEKIENGVEGTDDAEALEEDVHS